MARHKAASTAMVVRDREQMEASDLALPAEVLPRDPASELERLIAAAVEKEVTARMGGADAVFQPWFQSKRVATAIRKLQTVPEREKWSYYFADWGCFVCEQKEPGHGSLGMCNKCYRKRAQRLRATLRKHAPSVPPENCRAPEREAPCRQPPNEGFVDKVKVAREALAPSIKALMSAEENGS